MLEDVEVTLQYILFHYIYEYSHLLMRPVHHSVENAGSSNQKPINSWVFSDSNRSFQAH